MGADYLSASTTLSDHYVTLTLVGEMEQLRPRLIEAMQTLGYRMLSEQPLFGKRPAKGSARWDCSLEVLDYPTTLTVSLKQINQVAVVATFSYEIKSYRHMTKGDRQTLMREAEAIAALATESLSISACPGCGTQITDDSHFCRRCGAPLVVDVAEMEVLRLTKKTRTAYHNLVIAIVMMFVTALLLLAMLVFAPPKADKVLFWITSAFGGFALFALLQGIWQIHYTLNPKNSKELTARPQPSFAASVTTALPPRTAQDSVTEGTTELLFNSDRRVAEPIQRKSPDTSGIDEERLM